MYQSLRDDDGSVYCRLVEWKTIRSAYERAFAEAKKDGETQETVAERGGIRQNDLSRLFQNDKKGPQVATFVKAIKGLREGMTVSEFFLQIEGKTNSTLQSDADARRTTRPLEESVKSGRQGRTVPLDAPSLLAAGDALVEAGGRLIAAASGIAVGKDASTTDRVRGAKPAKGARRAAHR